MKNLLILAFYMATITLLPAQQAELHISNESDRTMEIKIMRNGYNGGESLYSKLTIAPQSRSVKYFPTTGHYFLKVKASRYNRPTVYTRGDPFRVYVGDDGYDVLTITYSIQESTLDPLSGEVITQAQFEKDN